MASNRSIIRSPQAEIVSLRNERSKTYRQPDGSRILVAKTRPWHYRDDDGAWAEIDLTFRQAQMNHGRAMALLDRNQVSVGVRADGETEKAYGLRPRGRSDIQLEYSPISWAIDGAERVGRHTAPQSRGQDLSQWVGDVEIITHPTYTGVVNALRLTAAHEIEISEQMHLAGLRVANELVDGQYMPDARGRFVFVDADGIPRFWINRPWYRVDGQERVYGALAHELGADLVYTKRGRIDATGAVEVDTTTYYAESDDGRVYKSGASSTYDWTTDIRNATTGTDLDDSSASLPAAISGTLVVGTYYCHRSFFRFDTSGLDDDATITSATLGVYGLTNGGIEIDCFEGTQGSSLDLGDYNAFTGSALDTIASWNASDYNEFSPGTASVSKTGSTRYCLRESAHDVDDVDPTDASSRAGCYYSEETGESKDPELIVGYTLSATVTPGAAAIAVSAPAPTVDIGQTAAPPSADVAVSAPTPSVAKSSAITPPSADVAVSAPAPSYSKSSAMLPDAATIVVSALVPTATAELFNIDTLDHWGVDIVSLSDWRTGVGLDPVDLWSVDGEVIQGATAQRLLGATVEGPSKVSGGQSELSRALSFTGHHVLVLTPSQDPDVQLFGLITKDDLGYGPGERDNKARLVVPGIESLLRWLPAEDGSGDPIAVSDPETADDFMKRVLSVCTTGTDVGGNSRAWSWGTLEIEADESAAGNMDSTFEAHGEPLDELFNAIGKDYGVAWELRPTMNSDGTWTFTFSTSYPRGGSDKTSGADRVVISDLGGEVPKGERNTDRSKMINVAYSQDMKHVATDATSIATYGRMAAKTEAYTQAQCQLMLSGAEVKAGSTWTVNHREMGVSQWMAKWIAGDLVLRYNAELDIDGASEQVEAVIFKLLPEQPIQLQVRWGEKKVLLSDLVAPDAYENGSAGGGAGAGGASIKWAQSHQISSVARAKASGIADLYARGDHAHDHRFDIAGAATQVGPSGGVTYIQEGDGISLTVDDENTFTISADVSVSDLPSGTAQYQFLVTGVDPFALEWEDLSDLAGAGLTFSGGQFAVNPGTGIIVSGDQVKAYQHRHSISEDGDHSHSVTEPASDNATTSNWTAGEPFNPTANPLRNSNGTEVYVMYSTSSFPKTYVSMASDSNGSDQQWVPIIGNAYTYVGSSPHTHGYKLPTTTDTDGAHDHTGYTGYYGVTS